jgi:hypothetical protein
MTGPTFVLGLLIGFVAATLLWAWARHTPVGSGAGAAKPDASPPAAPSTVLERAMPVARHVVTAVWATAYQKATGRRLKGLELIRVLEDAEGSIEHHASVLARQVAHGYAEAVVDLRRALYAHSGIAPDLVDQAILVALQRDAAARAEGERGTDVH